MAGPLLIIDSASLYFRAYFGIPESAARAPDGSPVNAVRGFLDFLATLIRGRHPDRVICALDAAWRPARRGRGAGGGGGGGGGGGWCCAGQGRRPGGRGGGVGGGSSPTGWYRRSR